MVLLTEEFPGRTRDRRRFVSMNIADAGFFSIVGTALNVTGVLTAIMVWYEEQTAAATAVGLILAVTGCMVYGIGMVVSDPGSVKRAKRKFWKINVWVLAFMPLSILYNFLAGGYRLAPYPIPVGGRTFDHYHRCCDRGRRFRYFGCCGRELFAG